MHAAQRMHLRECQNRFIPRRADLPLSTRMTCMVAPLRGPRNVEVYCVIVSPVALRVSSRTKTARLSVVGMIFSIPTEHMCSSGVCAERSAFPSLVATTIAPVSATTKFAPVMPARALRMSGRVFSRITPAR